MKRIQKCQPTVRLIRRHSGLDLPVARPVRLLDLFLRKMHPAQRRPRQPVQPQHQPRLFLQFAAADDQTLTRRPRQQRNPGMHAQNLQHRFRVGEKRWRHENQPQRHLRSGQLRPQIGSPLLQASFVKSAAPMRRHSPFGVHASNLRTRPTGFKAEMHQPDPRTNPPRTAPSGPAALSPPDR